MRKYQERISGPLLDRIDIQVHVKPVPHASLTAAGEPGETSSSIRQRVVTARALQVERQGSCNAELGGRPLERVCAAGADAARMLAAAMDRMALSARAYHRILRVARTIADLDGCECIGAEHVAEAIQFRALDCT